MQIGSFPQNECADGNSIEGIHDAGDFPNIRNASVGESQTEVEVHTSKPRGEGSDAHSDNNSGLSSSVPVENPTACAGGIVSATGNVSTRTTSSLFEEQRSPPQANPDSSAAMDPCEILVELMQKDGLSIPSDHLPIRDAASLCAWAIAELRERRTTYETAVQAVTSTSFDESSRQNSLHHFLTLAQSVDERCKEYEDVLASCTNGTLTVTGPTDRDHSSDGESSRLRAVVGETTKTSPGSVYTAVNFDGTAATVAVSDGERSNDSSSICTTPAMEQDGLDSASHHPECEVVEYVVRTCLAQFDYRAT